MPEMTGSELLSRVLARSPETSRIILTAFGGPTARRPSLRPGAQCMIAKPWDDSMLRFALREFLFGREIEDPRRRTEFESKSAK
jgi:DNA-binding NarL/FixJ family response regulator